MARRVWPLTGVAALALLFGVVALPTLAADPSASPDVPGGSAEASAVATAHATGGASAAPPATTEASAAVQPNPTVEAAETAEPDKPGKPDTPPGQAKQKVPKQSITLSGTVTTGTDEDGRTVYRMSSGGTTYVLEAGPPWYFGDDYPLKPYVGEDVTIVGEVAEGSTEVDVLSVNGTTLREPGKPPWAGGWKRVGEQHPGWSAEKAARWAEKAERMKAKFGVDCWPPGHCKQQDPGQDVAPTH